VPELGLLGSVRGALSNERPYRECENPTKFCNRARGAKFLAICSILKGLRARKSEQNGAV